MLATVLSAMMGGNLRKVVPASQRLFFDGNSFLTAVWNIADGTRASTFGATFAGYTNIGIAGQTTRQMRGVSEVGEGVSDTDRQAMLASGAGCLVCVEITNSVYGNGRGVTDTLNQISLYNAECRAVQPNMPIVWVGAIPRFESLNPNALPAFGTNTVANQVMKDINSALAANPGAYGADGYVELCRAGGPYAFTDFTSVTEFDASGAYNETTGTARVHPNSTTGKNWIVSQIVAKLQAMQ